MQMNKHRYTHTLEKKRSRQADGWKTTCDDTFGTNRRQVSVHEGIVSKPFQW